MNINSFDIINEIYENNSKKQIFLELGELKMNNDGTISIIGTDNNKLESLTTTFYNVPGNDINIENIEFDSYLLQFISKPNTDLMRKIIIKGCVFKGSLKIVNNNDIIFENCTFLFNKLNNIEFLTICDSSKVKFYNCVFKSDIPITKHYIYSCIKISDKSECYLESCKFNNFDKDTKIFDIKNNGVVKFVKGTIKYCKFIGTFNNKSNIEFDQILFYNSWFLVNNDSNISFVGCKIDVDDQYYETPFIISEGVYSKLNINKSKFNIINATNICACHNNSLTKISDSEFTVNKTKYPCVSCYSNARFISENNEFMFDCPIKVCSARSRGIVSFINTNVNSKCKNKCACYIGPSSTLLSSELNCSENIEIPIKIDKRSCIQHGDLISKLCGHKVSEHTEICDQCYIKIGAKIRVNLEQIDYCICCLENKPTVLYECNHIPVCEDCYTEIRKNPTIRNRCLYCNIRSKSVVYLERD